MSPYPLTMLMINYTFCKNLKNPVASVVLAIYQISRTVGVKLN